MSSAGDRKQKGGLRHLSREELELWRQVTRSVTRLGPFPSLPSPLRAEESSGSEPQPQQRNLESLRQPGAATSRPPPALAPLERRLRKRLARGRSTVDDILDLHGLRQDEAHLALHGFLAAAQSRDAKVVLIVTGKGLTSAALPRGRAGAAGVLYLTVPRWLASPAFRALVAGFEEADRVHGGAGALYVKIRRTNRFAGTSAPRCG